MFDRVPVSIERGVRCTRVRIGDRRFVKGSAPGTDNNCLIFALLEALQDFTPVLIDVPWVRVQLQRRFPSGDNKVSERSFLDMRPHWRDVISLIGESAERLGIAEGRRIRPEAYRFVAVHEEREVIGDVVGEGPTELFILNEGFLHFVPLLRDRRR